MRRNSLLLLAMCLLAAGAVAQVVSPAEIKELGPRRLQRQYLPQLKQTAEAIHAHKFPYPFYFSRTLDIEQAAQLKADQRSIRFEKYNGQMVLEFTGNYYASYSSELMSTHERAKQTFEEVILPILRAAAPAFADTDAFASYAFEISHHVRRKVLGVPAEITENVMLIIPRANGLKLANATNPEEQQTVVLNAEMYVDGEPFSLWLAGDEPPDPPARLAHAKKSKKSAQADEADNEPAPAVRTVSAPAPTVSTDVMFGKPLPLRTLTDRELTELQNGQAATLARLTRELDPQAHFVSYAPPAFINLRGAAYLQLSMTTDLAQAGAASRYQLAALAFDEHISHLVSPVLSYFEGDPGFDGVDFSTSVRMKGAASDLAIEFVVPLKTLRCFATYDCTNQQLINGSLVLINGERVSLDLQKAEAGNSR